ncbi:aldehyde dehydrogenase family protein [Microbacterium sp. NIBRBAC000506063]|nr:aldehyde dehydrogenase family protein [Microbacterium sp. NIBRBAC000506063]
MELPADHDGLEACAGTRRGQQRDPQARRELHLFGAAPRRARHRGGHPRRRPQRHSRSRDETGRALGEHGDVDVVTFTGSPEVGRRFLGYSAASNGKRVWPELGGKTASLVLPDADLEQAVRATADGCFYNQGQMCTASSRLLVPRADRDRALEIAAEVARTSLPDDPFAVTTSMGAIVGEGQLRSIAGFVERAVAEGGEIAAGSAERYEAVPGGSYFAPVVLGVTPEHEVARREVFGPVLSVIAYDDVEDALNIANGTEYGLAAALWSNDLNAVHRLSRRLKAGWSG